MKKFKEWFVLSWMKNETPDKKHFYRRGFTKAYLARKRRLKDLWIGSGLLALTFPVPAFLMILALFCCFISFAFLDEYPFN